MKYLNNVGEADHGKLKQLIQPVRSFKTMKTAYATIKGFEVMGALRNGQAGLFSFEGGIVGEARLRRACLRHGTVRVERGVGTGPSGWRRVIRRTTSLPDHQHPFGRFATEPTIATQGTVNTQASLHDALGRTLGRKLGRMDRRESHRRVGAITPVPLGTKPVHGALMS